jgi:chaperonin GroES
MILAPNLGKIIVRSEMQEKIGRIWVPETHKNNPPVEGTVIALGEDVVANGYVKAGDLVVFGKYAATDISDGDQCFMITEADIMYKKVIESFDVKEKE